LKARQPLDYFHPYPKQREFFALGLTKRERLLQAGNQTGKSQAGAFEVACHLTGLYPADWPGKRFDHPTVGWICGETGASVRDIGQTKLFGTPGGYDTSAIGMVAKELIKARTLGHGTADLYDQIRVQHISGGISTLSTKAYAQDARTWQGTTLDFVWIDEQPPPEHYNEALARLTGGGILFVTFTPLQGFGEVIDRFLRDDSPDALRDRGVVKMGLKDAEHFTEEQKQKRLAGYPLHEREARANGDPTLGSGAIFTTPQADISIDQNLQIPLHYAKLWGVDYGVTHPFAAVLMAWDRDADIIYILETVRLTNSRPMEHASAMRRYAPDIRVAWPHDGSRRESDLDTLTTSYRREGLLMLPKHASFVDGSISTEAGILEMQERMADGRFRVKAHLADWFDEYRGYHRKKDGQINKIRDDLLSATRIAVMSKRFARPGPIGGSLGMATARRSTPQMARNINFDLFA
jgi:phage terminase large subunit-like protein